MSRCSSRGAEAGAAAGPGAEAHARGGKRGRLLAWGWRMETRGNGGDPGRETH